MTHPLLAPALAAALWLAAGAAHAVTCENNIPPSNPDSVYTNNGNGTVTDTRTGLMWKQCLEGYTGEDCTTAASVPKASFTWEEALARAESSTFAGHTDWRLPNIKELRSLVEECRNNPAINDTIFGANPPSSVVWSGSPVAGSPNYAWYVHFGNGNAYYDFRDVAYHVRLVRGGQSLAPLPALSALALSGTPTASGAAVAGTSTLAGTGYWVVVPQGSAAPTPAQVKAQAAYGGVTLAAHGSAPMALNTQQTFAVSSLAASAAYDFYLVVQSEPNGPLSVLRKVSFNTAALTYAITATASPTLGGAVSCSPSTVTHGGGSTCTATANAGYRFSAWTGACASQSATCTLTDVQAAQASTAVFANEITVPEGTQTGQPIVVTPPAQYNWVIASARTALTSSIATPPPSTVELPYGVVSLQLTGGTTASTATVVLTYPEPLPAGTTYYKYGKTKANPTDHWYEFGGAVISGNTVTLTLTDGGAGDSDLAENGKIEDPGGPGRRMLPTAAQPIPTLSEWAMLLLAGLLGLLAAAAMRRGQSAG